MADWASVAEKIRRLQSMQKINLQWETPSKELQPPQMQAAPAASTAYARPPTPEEEAIKKSLAYKASQPGGMEQEVAKRKFMQRGPSTELVQKLPQMAKAMGEQMSGVIKDMMANYDAALSGRVVTEQGVRQLKPNEREVMGRRAAVNALDLALWWGGAAQTGISGVAKTITDFAKPQWMRIATKYFGKRVPPDELATFFNKITTPGSVFTNEDKLLIPRMQWAADMEKKSLPEMITRGLEKGVRLPRGVPPTEGYRPLGAVLAEGGERLERVPTGKNKYLYRTHNISDLSILQTRGLFGRTPIEAHDLIMKAHPEYKQEWKMAGIVREKETWGVGEQMTQKPRLYFVPKEETGYEGELLLRVRKDIADKFGGQIIEDIGLPGEYFYEGRVGIPTKYIEVKVGDKWMPIKEYKSPITKIPELQGKPPGAIIKEEGKPLIEELYPKKKGEILPEGGALVSKEGEVQAPKLGLSAQIAKDMERLFGKGAKPAEAGAKLPPPTKPPAPPVAGEPAPEPQLPPDVESARKKIVDLLTMEKPLSELQQQAYKAEVARRMREFEKTIEGVKGERVLYEQLKKMKGPLLKQKLEFYPIRNELKQEEVDAMFDLISANRDYTELQKLPIRMALRDVIDGHMPDKGMFPKLEEIFGSDFVQAILKNRGKLAKIRDIVTETLNLPKAFVASFDVSAMFRQGVFWTLRPSKAGYTWRASRQMFKDLFSEKAFKDWYTEIKAHPNFKNLADDMGIDFTGFGTVGRGLTGREEYFTTTIHQRILNDPKLRNFPILGQIAQGMRGSERAFTGFLDKLRWDVGLKFYDDLIKSGLTPEANPRIFKTMGALVNTTTGRGDLGRLNAIAQDLNVIFWSPKLIKARVDLLNPVWWLGQPGKVRIEAVKGLAEMLGTGSTILLLAKLAGADVEIDPRSTDWGKIRVGNTRWDIWGGYQQYFRVLAQVISGQRKTQKGEVLPLSAEKFPFETRLDRLIGFAKGKLSPTTSLALEIFEGQKMLGGPIMPVDEIKSKFIPMYIQDILDAGKEFGWSAIFSVGVPAITGVGVQTYEETKRGRKASWKSVADKIRRLQGGR